MNRESRPSQFPPQRPPTPGEFGPSGSFGPGGAATEAPTSEFAPIAVPPPDRLSTQAWRAQGVIEPAAATDHDVYQQRKYFVQQRAAAVAGLRPGESITLFEPGTGNVVFTRDLQNDRHDRPVVREAHARAQINSDPHGPSVSQGLWQSPGLASRPGASAVPRADRSSELPPAAYSTQGIDFGPRGHGSLYQAAEEHSVVAPLGQPAAYPNAGPDVVRPAQAELLREEAPDDPLRRHRPAHQNDGNKLRQSEEPQPATETLPIGNPDEPRSVEATVDEETWYAMQRNEEVVRGGENDRQKNSEDPTVILEPAQMTGGDDMTVLEHVRPERKQSGEGEESARTETAAPSSRVGAAAAADHAEKTIVTEEESTVIPGINPGVITSESQIPDIDIGTPRLPRRHM